MTELDTYWWNKGTEQLARARAGTLGELHHYIELTCDLTSLPDVWAAAELLTFDEGTEWELGLAQILCSAHAITATPAGDVVGLLEAAAAVTGDARIAALEAAWRACFAPAIADVIEALDLARDAPAMPVAKKKKDTELLWAEAAKTAVPRSLFAGEWPKTWRDAQRRMRPLYARPRSPLLAAAAIEFACRDPLPYTSIASSTYWQAHAWFIAEQADVRQLARLEAFERRMAPMWGERTLATDALRAFSPRPLPAKAAQLLATLAVPAKPARPAKLSLASKEDRAVAADQLLLDGDPRGELITVQEQLAVKPTPALIKRQAQLLKKHAKTWVPNTVYRDTCVFRGGVPVAGHLLCRSDPELATMIGSQALATFETLIIDESFAMGDLEPSTIAAVVASLPALRHVITTDAGAQAIARGAPTAIERLGLPDGRAVPFDGPGLPRLARVDASTIRAAWTERPWFARLAAIGTQDAENWEILRTMKLAPAVVLGDGVGYLHRDAGESAWELWAAGGVVTAKHQVGSTAKSLLATLARVTSWRGLQLALPENFLDDVAAFAKQQELELVATAAVDPIQDGISLELSSIRRDAPAAKRTRASRT